ncbi:hypothetical protein Peur_030107 [Populus x canadensis]
MNCNSGVGNTFGHMARALKEYRKELDRLQYLPPSDETFKAVTDLMRRRRGRQGFMSLKLDMCKAYDKVEWSFLRGIILKMGFNHNWVDLVMRCVTTASYSILINGIPGENLNPERGLKKGAPLSTYLFLLRAEYEDHERKICLTAWDIICRNKLGGGLGFRKLMLFQ